jgi:hypothetical protein
MIQSNVGTVIRNLAATAVIAGASIGIAAQPVAAGGLRNCVDITGKQSGQVACYENVWSDGVEYRMTFSNTKFTGNTPKDLDRLYVLAAQTDTPQGAPPNTFAHDHVVRAIPAHNQGIYSVKLQGFFVFCSGQGLVSGACVADWQAPDGVNPAPFAKTVNGRALTSTEAIELAAAEGHVVLVNLGPNAVIVGSISDVH